MWYAIIPIVAQDHQSEPGTLYGDGEVHTLPQLTFDLSELGAQALRHRAPFHLKVIETICTCFLAYKQAELAAAEQLKRYGNALTQAQEQHLSACEKRYLLAIKELARIRQLLTPRTTTVLNFANQQQVNVG